VLGDAPQAAGEAAFGEGVELGEPPAAGEDVDEGRSKKWTAKPPCW
jgi:hypothetical protein